VTNFFPKQDLREPNSSVLVAAFYVLQRQPWKSLAIKTVQTMKRLLLLTLLAVLLAAWLLPATAHARTYDVLNADVPFKFQIGARSFRPGHYQFVLVGPGLVALRDSHEHVIATLVTRSRDTDGPASATKLVFNKQKKHSQLAQIWMENRSQVLDVVGEEMAFRHTPIPGPPPTLRPDVNSLLERRDGLRLKN
jgi:hypothetical protein